LAGRHCTTPHINRRRIFPAVDGFDRNQDAQLRSDLDQDADSNNSRLSVARYEAEAFFNWIYAACREDFQFDRAFGIGCGRGATSSTNVGGAGFGDAPEAAAMRRFT
jgi:hypothetical protein